MKKITWSINISIFCVLLLLTGSASAALIQLEFTGTVSSTDSAITNLDIGDQFTFMLTVDDSVTDTNASVGAGAFPGLVTALSVTAGAGNTGSWTPSGTPDLPASNFVTNAFGNGITLQLRGTGYPDGAAGFGFQDYDFAVAWPTGISDSGLGDSFASQLGMPFALIPADLSFSIRFTDGSTFPPATLAVTVAAAPSATPIPTFNRYGLAVFALSLAYIGWRRRLQKV